MAITGSELFDKWLLRTRRGSGITVDQEGFHGIGEDILTRWQKEFQQDFCATCKHFDQANNRYRELKPDKQPDDCFHHLTDVVGACWSFRDSVTGKDIGHLILGDQDVSSK